MITPPKVGTIVRDVSSPESKKPRRPLKENLAQLSYYTALVMALMTMYLFMWKPIGVSYLVYSLLLILVSALPVMLEWVTPPEGFVKRFVIYSVVLLLPSVLFLTRLNHNVLTWTFVIIPPLSFTLLSLYAYHPEAIKRWGIFHLLKTPFVALAQWVGRSVHYIRSFRGGQGRKESKFRSLMGRSTLGFAISIPFLLIFIGLFMSSDPEFAKAFEAFVLKILSYWFEDFQEFIQFLFKLFAAFWVGLYIAVWNYFSWDSESELADRFAQISDFDASKFKRSWDYLVVSVFLFMLNLLFAGYVFVQGGYLFDGSGNVVGENAAYTYAEYARRGFGELVMVAIIVYLILLVVNLKTQLTTAASKIMYRVNAHIFALLTLVIGGSAMYRLYILQSVYGYTDVRFHGGIWMVLIGISIVSVVVGAWRKNYVRFTSLSAAVLAVSLMVFYAVFPIDTYLGVRNYERFGDTGEIDLPYMLNLSDEALPTIMNLAKDDELSENGRSVVRAELDQRLDAEKKARKELGWQSYSITRMSYYEDVDELLDGDTDLPEAADSLQDFLDAYGDSLMEEDFEGAFDMYWSSGTEMLDLSELAPVVVTDIDFEKRVDYEDWIAVNYVGENGYTYNYWEGMPIQVEISYKTSSSSFISRCVDEVLKVKLEDGDWKVVSAQDFVLGNLDTNAEYYYYEADDNSHLFKDNTSCNSNDIIRVPIR